MYLWKGQGFAFSPELFLLDNWLIAQEAKRDATFTYGIVKSSKFYENGVMIEKLCITW